MSTPPPYGPQTPPPPYGPPPGYGTPLPPTPKKKGKTCAGIGCGGLLLLVLIIVIVSVASSGGKTTTSNSPAVAATGAASTTAADPGTPPTPTATTAKAKPVAPKRDTVTYVVTGTGGADVQYGSAGSNSQGHVPMSVTKTLGNPIYYSITAQLQGSGHVTCKLEVNGKAISTATASGGYNIASCEMSKDLFTGDWTDTNQG